MAELKHHESIEIARTPEEVWDLVPDVTRTGEWSPICKACEWDEGAGTVVGAHFTGHNVIPGREWSTRSQVVAAERGRVFAWEVAHRTDARRVARKAVQCVVDLLAFCVVPLSALVVYWGRVVLAPPVNAAAEGEVALRGVRFVLPTPMP